MQEEIIMKIQNHKKYILGVVTAAVTFIIILIGIVVIHNTPENRANRHLELANKYLEKMDYEQAVVEFDKAIEIDPMNADAYLGKADAYVGLEDYDMSVQMLESVVQIVEEKPELQEQLIAKFISLADTYMSLGEYEKSLEIYDRLLDIDQGNEKILAGLEECLQKYVSWLGEQEKYDEIEKLSEKYMDKIRDVNFQTTVEKNILKLNEYGATAFEYRSEYKEYNDIDSEEKELINILIRYMESFDNMETLLLQIRNVKFPEKNNNYTYRIYTSFENYKVSFSMDSLYKTIIIRPEYGMGYCLVYYNANYEYIEYWNCDCSDWQWKGAATQRYYRNDGMLDVFQTNGMMEDSLRTGIWYRQYQGEILNGEEVEYIYDKGDLLLMDGVEQKHDGGGFSLPYGYDLQDEWGKEQVYW